MKKVLWMALAFILVSGAARAQMFMTSDDSSRIASMSADINVVEDYDLIFTFPNKVNEYKNTVDFRMEELDTTGDDYAGILDGKFTKLGVIGVYMNRPSTGTFNGLPYTVQANINFPLWVLRSYYGDTYNGLMTGGLYSTLSPSPLFDLFWGKQMGDLDFGVKVSYADAKDNEISDANYIDVGGDAYGTTSSNYSRQVGILFGVGKDGLGPFQRADLSVGYVLGKIDNHISSYSTSDPDLSTYGSAGIQDDGIHAITANVNVRRDMGENANAKFFAAVRLSTFGLKGYDKYTMTYWALSNPDGFTSKNESNLYSLGTGLNHNFFKGDVLVSAGARLDYWSYRQTASLVEFGVDAYDDATSYGMDVLKEFRIQRIDVPIFVSCEAKVAKWLALRAGAKYSAHINTIVTTQGLFSAEENSTSYSYLLPTGQGDIVFNTGFGLEWKNWSLDTLISTEAFEGDVADLQPGRGISYAGSMLDLVKAEMKYKF
jgi:hypothetical protein